MGTGRGRVTGLRAEAEVGAGAGQGAVLGPRAGV